MTIEDISSKIRPELICNHVEGIFHIIFVSKLKIAEIMKVLLGNDSSSSLVRVRHIIITSPLLAKIWSV